MLNLKMHCNAIEISPDFVKSVQGKWSLSCGAKLNYIDACAVEPYDVLKFKKSLHKDSELRHGIRHLHSCYFIRLDCKTSERSVHTHTHTHAHARARTRTRTHAHARTRTHTHTHTHTQNCRTEARNRYELVSGAVGKRASRPAEHQSFQLSTFGSSRGTRSKRWPFQRGTSSLCVTLCQTIPTEVTADSIFI